MIPETELEYDVVIVGGGPVGLLMAYQLRRFGVTACVVEQHEKETQDAYGRAIALFPRTTEQLDQLDLIDEMLQLGFACRTSVTYKNGERILPGRVWAFMENIHDTAYDFTLVLRQMYTEAILREKLESVGASYHQAVQCTDFVVDESAPPNSHAVTSMFVDKKTGQEFRLKSKYLVGADGGRSFVRRHAGIPFEGDTTEDKWIRIDGIVETDMPITRSYGAIESETHGNVLWAPLDHGATRIGYSYSADIAAKYPDGVTEEVAIKEAIESMKPFKVEFKEVHWWTVYTIGQRWARTFSTKGNRVFLCGDAAHTHSSGAAQGLNTGIHDAVNLGWKLAMQIKDLTQPEVLDTYCVERRSAVRTLMDYDRDISLLMSHKWPSWYTGDRNADHHVVLGGIFEKAASFNTGLGISYGANVLNRTADQEDKTVQSDVAVGGRPPDVELTIPGTNQKTRLQRVTRNLGRFWVLVFTGKVSSTQSSLQKLQDHLSHSHAGLKTHPVVGWVTISSAVGYSPYEAIGMQPFGNTYYDIQTVAHNRFGVDMDKGMVVILRPDGLLGSAGALEGDWIEQYFASVLKPLPPSNGAKINGLNGIKSVNGVKGVNGVNGAVKVNGY